MDEKSKPIKTLVLEDSVEDFRLIEELLSEERPPSFIVENKESLSTGLERLREGNIDVVLLDLGLPDSSGIETFLHVYAEVPNIPIIILTGIEDDTFASEAVQRGAQDYLVKGYIEPHNLVRAIRYAIERKKVEIELKGAQDKLEVKVEERTAELKRANLELQDQIAKRKQAQEVLQQNEERLRALYNAIPVPTYTWQGVGDDLMLVDFNDASQMITKGKIRDYIGIKAREMYQDIPEILEELHRCFSQKTTIEREMEYRLKSTGERKFLAVKYAFVPPDFVLVHTEDITERKGAEEELRKHRDLLEELVEERTAELKKVNEGLEAEISEHKQTEEALRKSEQFLQSTLDALSANIAILDESGTIIAVNAAWRRFADANRLSMTDDGVGINYLQICGSSTGDWSEEASAAVQGIHEVMMGKREMFHLEYPCHSPEEKRWFAMYVTRFESNDSIRVVVMHENITERMQTEEALEKLAHDLGERVKELNCLYGISDLIEKRDTLEEIFQGTVKLIPTGWHYPEITCARLILEGQEYKTENFRETSWKQRSDIVVYGQPVGAIEVAYLEEKPVSDEGPFLKEERNLINAIAERLGRIIEQVRARKTLTETNQLLTTILDYTPMLVAYLDPQFNFVRVNSAYAEADERDPSFFPGKNHFDLYPNNENKEIFQRVVNTGEPYFVRAKPFEYAEHPERGLTYWDWSLIPIKGMEGAVKGLVFTLENATERVRTEETIKASLAEKEVLLKEIHHRVRNNLQVINSLFSLQSRRIHDEESLAIFEKCKNRVNSIALVHEKLYESNDLANINFGDYIRTLTNQLLNSYSASLSAVAVNINASEIVLEVNRAIPCALIINELVMNSMKYAFPKGQKGEIDIELKSDSKGKVSIIVADNGVGLPPDFDITDSRTLGMQIINALVTQLHGSIKIDKGKRRGATFTVEFLIKE